MSSKQVGFQVQGDVFAGGSIVWQSAGRLLKALSDGNIDALSLMAIVQLGSLVPINQDLQNSISYLVTSRHNTRSVLASALWLGWGRTEIARELVKTQAGLSALLLIAAFSTGCSEFRAAQGLTELMKCFGCRPEVLPSSDAMKPVVAYLGPIVRDCGFARVYSYIKGTYRQAALSSSRYVPDSEFVGDEVDWAPAVKLIISAFQQGEELSMYASQRPCWFATFASYVLRMEPGTGSKLSINVDTGMQAPILSIVEPQTRDALAEMEIFHPLTVGVNYLVHFDRIMFVSLAKVVAGLCAQLLGALRVNSALLAEHALLQEDIQRLRQSGSNDDQTEFQNTMNIQLDIETHLMREPRSTAFFWLSEDSMARVFEKMFSGHCVDPNAVFCHALRSHVPVDALLKSLKAPLQQAFSLLSTIVSFSVCDADLDDLLIVFNESDKTRHDSDMKSELLKALQMRSSVTHLYHLDTAERREDRLAKYAELLSWRDALMKALSWPRVLDHLSATLHGSIADKFADDLCSVRPDEFLACSALDTSVYFRALVHSGSMDAPLKPLAVSKGRLSHEGRSRRLVRQRLGSLPMFNVTENWGPDCVVTKWPADCSLSPHRRPGRVAVEISTNISEDAIECDVCVKGDATAYSSSATRRMSLYTAYTYLAQVFQCGPCRHPRLQELKRGMPAADMPLVASLGAVGQRCVPIEGRDDTPSSIHLPRDGLCPRCGMEEPYLWFALRGMDIEQLAQLEFLGSGKSTVLQGQSCLDCASHSMHERSCSYLIMQ